MKFAGGGGAEWPGLTANPHEVRFDPQKMNEVAQALEDDLQRYQDALAQLNDPYTGTDLSPQDLGDWDVARDLALAAHKAHTATTKTLQEFLQQYRNVIAAIRVSAGNLQDAEDMTTSQVSQVDGGAPGSFPTQTAPTNTPSFD